MRRIRGAMGVGQRAPRASCAAAEVWAELRERPERRCFERFLRAFALRALGPFPREALPLSRLSSASGKSVAGVRPLSG